MYRQLLLSSVLAGIAFASQAQVHEELKGKFAAVLVVTDEKATATVQSASRGTKMLAAIKLVGCSPNSAGNCNSEADIRIFNPKGILAPHSEHVELWKNKAPAPGEVITGLVFGLTFPRTDPVGQYRIEATVRDLVSGQSIELLQVLHITK